MRVRWRRICRGIGRRRIVFDLGRQVRGKRCWVPAETGGVRVELV